VLDAHYGDGDRAAGMAAAASLESFADGSLNHGADARSERIADECALGQWRLRFGDRAQVRRSISVLRTAEMPRQMVLVSANQLACASLLDAAFALETGRADARQLVLALDSLMLSGPAISDATTYANIVLARLYQRMGDRRAALAAFRRRSYMSGWPRYLATIRREESQLATALGDTATANASLARYAALRHNPEPVVVATADTVRKQMAVLDANQSSLPLAGSLNLPRSHRRRAVAAAPHDK
jgi:hypothetical protein